MLSSCLRITFLFFAVSCHAQTNFFQNLADSAETLTQDHVIYDPSYFSIPYPNGDVPKAKGVCTDVVIRAYRKMGIDLQKEVHEDMERNFGEYPNIWGLTSTDENIDHRRVPNLMKFFERRGNVLVRTANPLDYKAGDIVCWDLGNGVSHIGVLVESPEGDRPYVVHNIGSGQVIEDILFDYRIIGHYRYKKS